MNKALNLFLPALIVVSLLLTCYSEAQAQLILVNLKVKIVKVERKKNRLQVRVHEKGNKNVQYIEIDDNTKFSKNNKQLSYDEAWKIFKENQIIRVKGGYTMSLHVKAKQIYM